MYRRGVFAHQKKAAGKMQLHSTPYATCIQYTVFYLRAIPGGNTLRRTFPYIYDFIIL